MYVTLVANWNHLGAAILTTSRVATRPHAPQLPPLQSNMSPDSYYPQNATAQLNAVYNREARSPRTATNPNPPQLPPIGGGPVPKFQTVKNTADLVPKINTQPPFRRANPEGGFISVSRTRLDYWAVLTVTIASPGADGASAHHVPAVQHAIQLPVVPKSTPSSHKAEQGSQERWLRQRGQRLHSLRQRYPWVGGVRA